MLNRRQLARLGGAAALIAPAAVRAQNFPAGRVSIIVPFPAGAATDITGRVVAERLGQMWGQAVVIDNRGGGNGLPAAEAAAKARPDGLTIFLTSAMTQAVNPALYDKLPYDPVADFEPITRFGTSPFVVLVRTDSPIKTLADLTALLKAEPGKHNFGAGALPARIASELYRQLAGVDALYIGYKSNPQAFPDLLNGQLTFMVIDTINGKLQIDRGTMRGLAVTLPQREPRLAQVPTAGEAGLPDFQIWTWTGFYAPKGTPGELVARLNRDIVAACQDRQVLARLDTMGSTPSTTTPEEFAAFTRTEIARWGGIIRRGNIKLE
ncbi:MAG: Bug family tripartite tricarboxylate transporter substrate binding protein [Reyranella sp.]|uniref:Bug family tripartite tricarboxylate transporter substrate binding protein n=1 Tax=Reyranella sp. TaxID=1929291 RepID=UPI003D107234